MCEANAFLEKNGADDIVMKNVGRLTFERDEIVLESFLGEQTRVAGELKEINFLENRIIITPR